MVKKKKNVEDERGDCTESAEAGEQLVQEGCSTKEQNGLGTEVEVAVLVQRLLISLESVQSNVLA